MATSVRSGCDIDRLAAVKKFDETKMGVKGLCDSGVASIPEIFVHPPETLPHPKNPQVAAAEIPVINFSAVDSPDGWTELVRRVRDAARTWGFFQVINHGIPTKELEAIMDSVREFHEQPNEHKSKYYKRDELHGVVYSSNNDLYRSKAATWHDYLQVWISPERSDPRKVPEVCRETVFRWAELSGSVGEVLLELLSEGLGLGRKKLREASLGDSRLVTGVYYPRCPQPELTMGLVAHTDPGTVTVLVTNGVRGLQIKHGDEWVDVDPVPGGLIVNIGDFLQMVSNDEYTSVPHRVVANPGNDPRITVVMFFNLVEWLKPEAGSGFESEYYGPLPELLSAAKPAVYRNFTKEEYYNNFFGKGLDCKYMIDKFKLS